jgi:hypothetical protein
MKTEEDLLVDCWMLIFNSLKGCGGKTSIHKAIQRNVKHLYHRYGIRREEIESIFCIKFRERRRHLKYDPGLSSLNTYVAKFVYYELLTLKELCRKQLDKSRTIPLSELENGEKLSRSGCSLNAYERHGIDAVINNDSPEDELIGKELMEIALKFFGEKDLSVLLGAKDRQTESARLGVDYFTYCKHLNRKTLKFRSYLKHIGYLE